MLGVEQRSSFLASCSCHVQIWCSIFCLPMKERSTFIAVINPKSYETVYTYYNLESRVTYVLPVKQMVSSKFSFVCFACLSNVYRSKRSLK